MSFVVKGGQKAESVIVSKMTKRVTVLTVKTV